MEEFGFNTDDLVCELYQPKQKKPIPKVNYSPKIDSSLWFINCNPKDLKIEIPEVTDEDLSSMKHKTKAEKNRNRKLKDDQNEDDETKNERKDIKIIMRMLLYRSDYYYQKHEYQKCINDCKELIRFVRHLGDISQLLTVLEVEIRCLVRLNQFDSAIEKIISYERIATQPRPSPIATNNPTTESGEEQQQQQQQTITFKDSNIIYLLAQSYHRVGRYEDAIKQYQRALTYNQVVWEWWFNLGNCYIKREFLERATIIKSSDNNTLEIFNLDKALNTIPIDRLLCCKRSITMSLYHIMSSFIQKKSLDSKAGWSEPLRKAHETISQNYQNLIEYDFKDLIEETNNQQLEKQRQQQQKQQQSDSNQSFIFNEFEIQWFIQYKDKEVVETEQLEEENPYNL